jgi:Ca2+-binding RTX toxin-like protein
MTSSSAESSDGGSDLRSHRAVSAETSGSTAATVIIVVLHRLEREMAIINGTNGNDGLVGTGAPDSIFGLAGNDMLKGGGGADLLDGGTGTDMVFYGDSFAGVTVNLTNGQASGGTAHGDTLVSIEIVFGSAHDDVLTGSSANNELSGGAGDDTLNGGQGADRMDGGDGDDVYFVDSVQDVVLEDAGGGIDHISTSVSLTLQAQVENTTMLLGALNVTGNDLDNIITGNLASNILDGGGGADTLDGGQGTDVMRGGRGNDIYFVDNSNDFVLENAGEGIDEIRTSVSVILPDTVENALLLEAGGSINVFGNGLANILTGNAFDNLLQGGGSDDTLSGGDGADTLDGGTGADAMRGGDGNDIYVVDNSSDVVVESVGEGLDEVRASVSFILSSTVENALLLEAGGSINATGNAFANVLTGNSFANVLSGLASPDTLVGGGGDDTLDGGAGADSLTGGTGNDTYIVDSATDQIFEFAGEGVDKVVASVTHNLIATVENLDLAAGAGAIDGFGNALANVMVGNESANVFNGSAGDDTLSGGDGDDVLFGFNDNDILDGGQGNDRVSGGFGDDTLSGGAGSDFLEGSFGINVMDGGADNDVYAVMLLSDLVIEQAGGGHDKALVTVSGYTLAANVEDGKVNLASGLQLLGNELDNGLTGNAGDDALVGFLGNDVIAGAGGIDEVQGREGNDTLNGEAGNDFLTGGLDNDSLTGGSGDDLFIFNTGDGLDVITDFVAGGGEDEILLVGHGFSSFAVLQQVMSQQGADVLININSVNQITLQNVTLGALDANDFFFG